MQRSVYLHTATKTPEWPDTTLYSPLLSRQSLNETVLPWKKVLACCVFGGKCKIWPRDNVSPCVTSASLRRREWRACCEIAHNFDEKISCSPYYRNTCKELTRNPRGKKAVANSGKQGKRPIKVFLADDGLFWARLNWKIRYLISLAL